VPEIVALSIVACVFLQLAHTLKVGRLTRSDILLDWIGRRKPDMRHLLEGIYYLVGAALMAILFNASLPMLSKAWRQGLYVGAEGDFMAPVWPVKLIILIGCLAAGIQFLLSAWKEFRAIIQPPALPEEENGGAR
jgi:TRAP-type mannitol/chloroaromatic compound transport system permease small subunit